MLAPNAQFWLPFLETPIFFNPLSFKNYLTKIRKFGNNKSQGHDDIKPGLFKQIANDILYRIFLSTSLSSEKRQKFRLEIVHLGCLTNDLPCVGPRTVTMYR